MEVEALTVTLEDQQVENGPNVPTESAQKVLAQK